MQRGLCCLLLLDKAPTDGAWEKKKKKKKPPNTPPPAFSETDYDRDLRKTLKKLIPNKRPHASSPG